MFAVVMFCWDIVFLGHCISGTLYCWDIVLHCWDIVLLGHCISGTFYFPDTGLSTRNQNTGQVKLIEIHEVIWKNQLTLDVIYVVDDH